MTTSYCEVLLKRLVLRYISCRKYILTSDGGRRLQQLPGSPLGTVLLGELTQKERTEVYLLTR